jgi:hypothetical protein
VGNVVEYIFEVPESERNEAAVTEMVAWVMDIVFPNFVNGRQR